MDAPQIETLYNGMWFVETTYGTEYVPLELIPDVYWSEELIPFLKGHPLGEDCYKLKFGWYARLSAPGYLEGTGFSNWYGPFAREGQARYEVIEDFPLWFTDEEDQAE